MIYWILLPKAEEGFIDLNICQINNSWLEATYYIYPCKFLGCQPLRPGQPKRSCSFGSYEQNRYVQLFTWLASFHMGALLCKMSFLRFLFSSIDSFFSASVTWTYYEQKRGENNTLEIESITTGNSVYIIWSLLWYPSTRDIL